MGSVSWYQGKQVFRFLRAPMVKSINTSQPLLRIVFQCNKRKQFWNFNYKYKFNIKKKHLQMLLVVYFHFWRQLLDAEVYWLPLGPLYTITCTLFCLLGFECWILLSWFLWWSFFPLSQYFDVFRVKNKGIIKLKNNNTQMYISFVCVFSSI